MTTLSTHAVDNPDELALFADDWTPLAKPFADRFRDACEAEANAHAGWVDPNRVRARLIADDPTYNPRQLSGLWSKASGKDGFLDVYRDVLVRISGEGSKGNGNKSVPMRRWRGWRS